MNHALNNVSMITASAGTGKTYSLMGEISRAINSGTKPSQILATTFTKKAAAELIDRVQAELFGQERPDAARQMSVSMVGTVNSVCSRLLQEYAVDAGLSPALQVIAEDEQLRIFQLATDSVFAEFTPRIQPLARRLGHDGEADIRGTDTDWRKVVRDITDAARSNRISPAALTHSAVASWQGLQRVLGPARLDDRATWSNQLLQGLMSLRGLATEIAESGKTPPKNLLASIALLEPVLTHASPEDAPWRFWIEAAGVSNANAKRLLEGYISAVEIDLTSNPAFQTELREFTQLVFACAAACLDRFADFKRQYGLIDFADQETLVLDLLENTPEFRASITGRIKFMVVDEFQDTSPLQLQLFTKFAELVDKVVWVGDSKQAIYEFRGTDPELMKAMAARVESKTQLHDSWRSKEAVIDLSNAISFAIFPELGEDEVRLTVPEARRDETHPKNALGGAREAWTLAAKTVPEQRRAVAAGVVDLIQRRGFRGSDVAVLARSNDAGAAIAAELAAFGVKATTNTSSLFAAREIQLVRAGMAFVASDDDTVALAELAHLHPDHPQFDRWVPALFDAEEPTAELRRWADDPLVSGLVELRGLASVCTPTEIMEEVTSRLGVARLIKKWSNPGTRLKNLDALRSLLEQYYESCAALSKPVTLSGSLRFLADADSTGSENFGDDVVNVLTYHKAKGLEWPAVVLASLDTEVVAKPWGVAVEGVDEIDVSDPLVGRWIRFWAWPFGTKGFKPLSGVADSSAVAQRALARRQADSARVLYVGLTRSVSVTCLAAAKPAPASLNSLGTGPIVEWAEGARNEGTLTVQGRNGEHTLSMDAFSYEPADGPADTDGGSNVEYEDCLTANAPVSHKPARVTASSLESFGFAADVTEAAALGPQLIPHGAANWDQVGSAIHGYFALPLGEMGDSARLSAAQRLLDRWGAASAVGPGVLVDAGERMLAFFARHYPGATVTTEQSVAWRNADNQLMEGWIDLLLETPAGYVLVDHKSYPGNDPVGHIKDKYIGQMRGYAEAIESITGRPVVETLIHMPALGKVYRIS
ncbi:exodeoxyribonuclease V subunit beta [Arthrobacter sp. ISL-5]|uniref:UvrD-helicase domain-containing protein n=1 Tax=Arthrobacter sp. ISL-5 TaxID=2819111 RepID=UPI001BE8A501|nr:UvrD-helicase domain-containing protein [Arthrobacter sp. ISL-5]MBT2554487.1 UvrD-helicase domain-containing protein [Arthrobacter sp. ISL-5]